MYRCLGLADYCASAATICSRRRYAFATLGYQAPNLFYEIERNSKKLVQNGNPQNISNACYAIVILGLSEQHKALLVSLWNRAIDMFGSNVRFEILDLENLDQ